MKRLSDRLERISKSLLEWEPVDASLLHLEAEEFLRKLFSGERFVRKGTPLLSFSLSGERFAVKVHSVRELLRSREFDIQFPPQREEVALTNLRGETLEIAIPERVLGDRYKSKREFFLALQHGDSLFGLFVDPPFVVEWRELKDLLPVKGVPSEFVEGECGGDEPLVVLSVEGLCGLLG